MEEEVCSPHPVLDNLKRIRERISAAARRAGRDPGAAEIVAVIKSARPEDVRVLLEHRAVRWVGENRIQAALHRLDAAGPAGRRFIGHLQTNKARQAAGLFDWIDSLDSLRLAEALEKALQPQGSRQKVLIQVKLTDRESQGGVAPGELEGFLNGLDRFPSLIPGGLMAIAPMIEPLEAVRPHFRTMYGLFVKHFGGRTMADGGPYLSMGMSQDFEIAVEEGANLVRIGTALFERFIADMPLQHQGGYE